MLTPIQSAFKFAVEALPSITFDELIITNYLYESAETKRAVTHAMIAWARSPNEYDLRWHEVSTLALAGDAYPVQSHLVVFYAYTILYALSLPPPMSFASQGGIGKACLLLPVAAMSCSRHAMLASIAFLHLLASSVEGCHDRLWIEYCYMSMLTWLHEAPPEHPPYDVSEQAAVRDALARQLQQSSDSRVIDFWTRYSPVYAPNPIGTPKTLTPPPGSDDTDPPPSTTR